MSKISKFSLFIFIFLVNIFLLWFSYWAKVWSSLDGLLQNIYYKAKSKDNPNELPDKLQVWDVFLSIYDTNESSDYTTKIESIQIVADYMNEEYIPNGCNLDSSEVWIMLYQNKNIRNILSDILKVPSYQDFDIFYDTFYSSCMKLNRCLYPDKTDRQLQTTENLRLCVSETSTAYYWLLQNISRANSSTKILNGENIFLDGNSENSSFDLLVDINLIWKVMFKWDAIAPETLFFDMPNSNRSLFADGQQTTDENQDVISENNNQIISNNNWKIKVSLNTKKLSSPNTWTISATTQWSEIINYTFQINDKIYKTDKNLIPSLTITEDTNIWVEVVDWFGETWFANTILIYESIWTNNINSNINQNVPAEVNNLQSDLADDNPKNVNQTAWIQAWNPCIVLWPENEDEKPSNSYQNIWNLNNYMSDLDILRNNLVPNPTNRYIQNQDQQKETENTTNTLSKPTISSPSFGDDIDKFECEDSCSDIWLLAKYQRTIQTANNNINNYFYELWFAKDKWQLDIIIQKIENNLDKISKDVLQPDENNGNFVSFVKLKSETLNNIKNMDFTWAKTELLRVKSEFANVFSELQTQSQMWVLSSEFQKIFQELVSKSNLSEIFQILDNIKNKLENIKKEIWPEFDILILKINVLKEKIEIENMIQNLENSESIFDIWKKVIDSQEDEKTNLYLDDLSKILSDRSFYDKISNFVKKYKDYKKIDIPELRSLILGLFDSLDSGTFLSNLAKDRAWQPNSRQRESCLVWCCINSCKEDFENVKKSIQSWYDEKKKKIEQEYEFKKKYSEQMYLQKVLRIEQEKKDIINKLDQEYQQKLENNQDEQIVKQWYFDSLNSIEFDFNKKKQDIEIEFGKTTLGLRKRYDDNLWEITKNMMNELSKVNQWYGNSTNKAICMSECMCGEISWPLPDSKLDELTQGERSPQISYKIKFCRIPVEVQSIVPKAVRTVEEVLEEINIVLNNLKESWQLMKHIKTKEMLDTSMMNIKLWDIFSFNFFVRFKPIFETIQWTQFENEKNAKNEIWEREIRKTYWDLEIVAERNKYLIKSNPEIYDASNSPATSYESFVWNINNMSDEIQNQNTDESRKLFVQAESEVRSQVSEEMISFVNQNWIFWTEVVGVLTAMNDVADNLRSKIER